MPIPLPPFMLPNWLREKLEKEGALTLSFDELPKPLQNYLSNTSEEEFVPEGEPPSFGVPSSGMEPSAGPFESASGIVPPGVGASVPEASPILPEASPILSEILSEALPSPEKPQLYVPAPGTPPSVEKPQPRVPPPVTPTPPGVLPVEKPDFGMIIGVLQEQLKKTTDPDAAARISKEIREAYKSMKEEAEREVVEVPQMPAEVPIESAGREVVEVPVEPEEVFTEEGVPVAGRPMIPEEETHIGELREVAPPKGRVTARAVGLTRLAQERGVEVSPEVWRQYADNIIQGMWADSRWLRFLGGVYRVRKQILEEKPKRGREIFRGYLGELFRQGYGYSGVSADEASAMIPFLVDVIDNTMEANPATFERVVESMLPRVQFQRILPPRAKGGFANFVTSLAATLGMGALLPVQAVGAVTGERGREFARGFKEAVHFLGEKVRPEGITEKVSALAGNLLGFAVSLMPWSRGVAATGVPELAAQVAEHFAGPRAGRLVGEIVLGGGAFVGASGAQTPKEAGKQFVLGGLFPVGRRVGMRLGRAGKAATKTVSPVEKAGETAAGAASAAKEAVEAAAGAAPAAEGAGEAVARTISRGEKLGGLVGEGVAGALGPFAVGERPTPEQVLEMGALPFVMALLGKTPRVLGALKGQLQNNILPTLQRLGDRVHSITAEMAENGTWKVMARLKDGTLQHLATLPKEAGAFLKDYGGRAVDAVVGGLADLSRRMRRVPKEEAPAAEATREVPTGEVEVAVGGEAVEGGIHPFDIGRLNEALREVPSVYQAFSNQLGNILPSLREDIGRIRRIVAEEAEGAWNVGAVLDDGTMKILATLPKEAGKRLTGDVLPADIIARELADYVRRSREMVSPSEVPRETVESVREAPRRVEIGVGEGTEARQTLEMAREAEPAGGIKREVEVQPPTKEVAEGERAEIKSAPLTEDVLRNIVVEPVTLGGEPGRVNLMGLEGQFNERDIRRRLLERSDVLEIELGREPTREEVQRFRENLINSAKGYLVTDLKLIEERAPIVTTPTGIRVFNFTGLGGDFWGNIVRTAAKWTLEQDLKGIFPLRMIEKGAELGKPAGEAVRPREATEGVGREVGIEPPSTEELAKLRAEDVRRVVGIEPPSTEELAKLREGREGVKAVQEAETGKVEATAPEAGRAPVEREAARSPEIPTLERAEREREGVAVREEGTSPVTETVPAREEVGTAPPAGEVPTPAAPAPASAELRERLERAEEGAPSVAGARSLPPEAKTEAGVAPARERRFSLAEVVDKLEVPAELPKEGVLGQERAITQVRNQLKKIAEPLRAVIEAGGAVSGVEVLKQRGVRGARIEVTLPRDVVERLKESDIIVEEGERTFLKKELGGGVFGNSDIQRLTKAWLDEMAKVIRGEPLEGPRAKEAPSPERASRWQVEDIMRELRVPLDMSVRGSVESSIKNELLKVSGQLLRIAEVDGRFNGIRSGGGNKFFLQFQVSDDRVRVIEDIVREVGYVPKQERQKIVELKEPLSGQPLLTNDGKRLLRSFVAQFLDIASGKSEPLFFSEPSLKTVKKKEAEVEPEPSLELHAARDVEIPAQPVITALGRAGVTIPPLDPKEPLTNITFTLKRGAFSITAESAREPGKRIVLFDNIPAGEPFVRVVETLRDNHIITGETAKRWLDEAARMGSAVAKEARGGDVDPGIVEVESAITQPELVFGPNSAGEGPAVAREAMRRGFSAVMGGWLTRGPEGEGALSFKDVVTRLAEEAGGGALGEPYIPPAVPKPRYWHPRIEEPSGGGPVRPWTTEYQMKVLAGIGRVLHPFGEAAERILARLRNVRVSIMLGSRLVRADAFLQVTKAKAELMRKFDLNKHEMNAIDRQGVEVATLVEPVWKISVDPNTGDLVFDISDWQLVTRHRAGWVSSQKAFEQRMEKQGFKYDTSKQRWVDPDTGREYWAEVVTIGNIKKLQVYVDPSKTVEARQALDLVKRGSQPGASRMDRALYEWVRQYKERAKYLELAVLDQAGLEGYVPTVTSGVPDYVRGFGQPVAPERKYRKGMGTLPERLSDAMMMLRSDFGLEALHKYHAAEVLSSIGSVVAVVPGRTTLITKEFIGQLAQYDRVNTRYGSGKVVAVDHQRGKVLVMLDPRPGEMRDKPVMRTIDLNKQGESLEKLEREKQLGILMEFAGNGEKRRQAVGDYAEALFISKGASPEEARRARRVVEDIFPELVGSYEQTSQGAPVIFRPRVIWSEFVAPKFVDVKFEGDVAKFVRAGGRIVPVGTDIPEGYRRVGHGWVLYAVPPDTLKLFRQLGDGVLEKGSLVYGALRWVTDKMRLGYVTQLATAVRDVVTTLYSTLYLKSFKDTLSGITARVAGAVPDFVTAEASALAPFYAGWRMPGYLVDAAREGWKLGAPSDKRLYLLRSLVDTVKRDVAFIEQGKGLDPVSRAFVVMYSFVRLAADISAQATGIAAELWKRGYEIGRREFKLDRPSAREFATKFADWAPAVIGRQDPVWKTKIGEKSFEVPAEKIREAYTRAVEESAHWRYTGDDLAVPLEEAARSKIARLLVLYPRFAFITLQYLMSTPFRWLPYINARKFELPSNLRETLREVVRRYPDYFDEYYNIEKVQPRALEELTKAPRGRKVQEVVEAAAPPLAVYLSGVVLKQLADLAGYDLDFRFGPKTEDERKEARLRGVYYPAMVFRNTETGEETWIGIGSLNSIVLVASAVMSLQDLYRDLRIMMAREYGIPYTDEDIEKDFTDLGPHLEAMFKQYGISPGVQFFVELVQAPFRPGQLGRAARTFGAAVARALPLGQTFRWLIDPSPREYVNLGTGEHGFLRGFAAEFPGLSRLLPERRPPVGRVQPMPKPARALGVIGYTVSPEQITLARLGVGYPAAPPKEVDRFIRNTESLIERVRSGQASERDLERYFAVVDTYDRIMEILNDPNVSDAGIRKWRAQKEYEEYRERVMRELRSGHLEERREIARELMETQSPQDFVLRILSLAGGPEVTEGVQQRIVEPIYIAEARNITDLVNREEPIRVFDKLVDPRELGRAILNYIIEQRGLRRRAEQRAAAKR
jgi:hypothetical protein